MTLSQNTPASRGESVINRAHRYTEKRAAARAAPGDERAPSGFPLISALADGYLVTALEVEGRGRSRWKLQHTVRPPHEPHHTPPRRHVRIDLFDPFLVIEEHGIDRELHEQHVDPIARVDPHSVARLQAASEHQSDGATDERAFHLELVGERLPRPLMHRPWPRHQSSIRVATTAHGLRQRWRPTSLRAQWTCRWRAYDAGA